MTDIEKLAAIIHDHLKKTLGSNHGMQRRRTLPEIKKILDKLELGDLETLIGYGHYLLTLTPYEDARQKIFNELAGEIARIADIEPLEYTPEGAADFRYAMTAHVLLSLIYTEL